MTGTKPETGPGTGPGLMARLRALPRRVRRRLTGAGTEDAAPALRPRRPRSALYTLVIPTFDRPGHLDRLLSYLERRGADFPILVLDSSPEPAAGQNAARCVAAGPAVTRLAYPPDKDPYEKVADGLRAVATPFVSLCADDDVLLLPALDACLAALERQPALAAAHGTYLNFSENESRIDLEYLVYRGPSILGADAVARLQAQFAAYEAVYYAVMRVQVARQAFMRTGDMDTTLGRELLTAALTVAQGEVLRLPMLYYARSTGQSYSYANWHPHQILARDPAMLFREYARFREILADGIAGTTRWQGARGDLLVALDMVFLKYMGSFLDPRVLDLIARDRLAGMDAEAVVADIWTTFVSNSDRSKHPETPLFPDDGGGFAPDRYRAGAPIHDYVCDVQGPAGSRRVRLLFECAFPDLAPPAILDEAMVRGLLEEIGGY